MGQVIWANASGQAGVQFTQISQRTRRLPQRVAVVQLVGYG